MLQVGCDLDFLEEPFGPEDGGEFGPQHLDRDLAVVFQVLGEVDGRHPAHAKLSLNGVAVGEGGGETFEVMGHRWLNYQRPAVPASRHPQLP